VALDHPFKQFDSHVIHRMKDAGPVGRIPQYIHKSGKKRNFPESILAGQFPLSVMPGLVPRLSGLNFSATMTGSSIIQRSPKPSCPHLLRASTSSKTPKEKRGWPEQVRP
jgi:hypothetical protein